MNSTDPSSTGIKDMANKIFYNLLAFILLATIIALMFACKQSQSKGSPSGDLTRSDVVGTYDINYDQPGYCCGKEVLILHDDGTYEQIFTSNMGKVQKNTGTWKFSAEKKLQTSNLYFSHFASYLDPWMHHVATKPSFDDNYTDVIRWFGDIKIVVNEDLGFEYIKRQ